MAYSMRAQYHMLNDHMDEAVRWGKKALEYEKLSPDPEIRMHALNNIGTAMVFRDKREGLDYLNESLTLALAHDHHEHAARAYNNMAEFAVEFRDFELAERILSDGLAFDTEHDLDAWTHYLSGRQAQLRMEQGRLDDAIRIAEGVVSLKDPSFLSRLPAELVLSRAYMRRGDEEAEQKMLQAFSDAIATDELQHIFPARLTMIEWAWLTNAPSRAGEHMQRLLELSDQDRHPWNIGARTVWADRLGVRMDNVSTDNLPKPFVQELDGQYESAARSWEGLGLPYEAALVRLRMEDDAAALEKAFNAFDQMNARLAMKRARALAERTGVSLVQESSKRGPYKAARSHPLGLTGKEQKVLRLLGEGLSNREIADELSRSQRTVDHHVSSILGKLNAQNRMAAILRLQREPWLIEE